MIENSLCLQVGANFCAFVRPAVILSSAGNFHRSGFVQNNGVRALVITEAGVIYIHVVYFEPDQYLLFSPGNLENM